MLPHPARSTMRVLLAAALALLAVLCLLPTFTPSSALVAAAPARQAAASSYVSDNRDLEEDDEDDVPAPRRTTASRRAAAAGASEEAESDDASGASSMLLRLTLEHSVDTSPFTRRGDVTLNFNPARGAKAITFSTPQTGSKAALSEALQASPAALYRLRFVQEGQSADDALMAAVPVCALTASHFHENLVFNVDPYGTLLSVSYRTPLSDCSGAEARAALAPTPAGSDVLTFVPKAKISFGKPGAKAHMNVRPGFDASSQANAQAVGADPAAAAAATPAAAEKGPDGKPVPPPQTFWQKYWIYIVPIGIWMVIQAVMAPQEQQAGAGGASGGAPAAGAARQ